jgi:hypothetical protein
MKVREQDDIDRIVGNAQSFKGYEARCSEIDAEADSGRVDKKASIEPPARTERIARPYKCDAHRHGQSLGD